MKKRDPALSLADLRNVGKATLGDFQRLGITTLAELAAADPDALHRELRRLTRSAQDPCVRDVFAATIHQARTGEALDWWTFTPERKGAAATPRSSRSRPATPQRTRARG